MAVTQPLKGSSNKIYSVITNFNKGIDKRTADDVASDSSFKELINFFNQTEGDLSKRPGVYNSKLTDFIKDIIDEHYTDKFNIVTNRFSETKATLITRLTDFYYTILCGVKKSKSVTYTENETSKTQTRYFQLDKVIGLQIIKNNKFLEALQDYKTILNGDYSEIVDSSLIEFGCILVGGGFTTVKNAGDTEESQKLCGLYVTRLNVKMEYKTGIGYDVSLEIDSVDPTISASPKRRWLYYPEGYNFSVNESDENQYINNIDGYIPLGPIDIANYNGFSYIPTGKNYLIKIDQIPESKGTHSKYTEEADLFSIIGGDESENIYKPTPVELTQIGFNILASDPLSYYDNSGSIAKVKGVFYSVNKTVNGVTFKQPVNKIPYNNAFNVHILYTGTTKPSDPEYRPDNGETDTTKNPYKKLPGAWLDDNKQIWVCSGVDSDQRFELKIALGDDTFITYINTTSSMIDETGYINSISQLVLSSTRIKLINNQLVLYGGHGYMFFSEYDMFNYFPNYYYVYIASEAGEEAVTSINYFRQFYAVYTNKRIKRMTGTFGADDFGIYPLNDFIGCPNGRTVRAVGNNLLFLGNDGLYKLKQGYLGEGTENVEKIDLALGNELSLNNVLEAFNMADNYVVVKNDGATWIVYNVTTNAFYEYNLESLTGEVYNGSSKDKDMQKKALPFYSIFAASLYDSNGDFFIVPMYGYNYSSSFKTATLNNVSFMTFRFSELDFLSKDEQHKDGYGFISSLETHAMNMGYPTNNKKFKEVYIKLINESGHAIPLYVTITVDDKVVINPEDYVIIYDRESNTYYYTLKADSNYELDVSKALGEFTLGKDKLGEKTIQQIKIKVREKGRSIRIKLSDGYNDTTELSIGDSTQKGLPVRNRNLYNFSISTIGIVYKVKKVKEG